VIREYEEKDFNSVTVLGRDIDQNYKFVISPVGKCYVYIIEDEVVGFVLADIFDDRAEIIDICVSLLHRNKKIGSELLNKIISLCEAKKVDNITLEVRKDNISAIKLYNNNNFKVISIRKKYYSNGTVDAYLMQRKM